MPRSQPSRRTAELIGLTEASALLGVSRWTVRRLIDNRDLPVVRLPSPSGATRRRVLIDRGDVHALIERSKWTDGF
jgi:excisionase family DNA binding protein